MKNNKRTIKLLSLALIFILLFTTFSSCKSTSIPAEVSPSATNIITESTGEIMNSSNPTDYENNNTVEPTAEETESLSTPTTESTVETLAPTGTPASVSTAIPTNTSVVTPTKTPSKTPAKTASKTPAPTKTPTSSVSTPPKEDNSKKIRQEFIDHLDEKYSDYTEVPYGLDITKKTDLVGIFYSTWFNFVLGYKKNPPNVTKILEEGQKTGVYNWGAENEFHYWAEPAVGYYRSDNESVIRTHMTQLAEAGVDFIIVDHTFMNASRVTSEYEWDIYVGTPCTVLLDTIVEMRAEGKKTPYVVFWSGSGSETGWAVVQRMYRDFYKVEKWKDCFVYWEGNLFQLVTRMPSTTLSKKMKLTVREMWGLEYNLLPEHWSFLQRTNEPVKDSEGFTEQMCVCTATQQTYMSLPTAKGRTHGIFMYSQWYNAFKHRPKVIAITWWNEWAAQRIRTGDGTYQFTDNYNQEYSRDIEPMKGGHGDLYYRWMKEYIRAYRNLESCPVLVEPTYEAQAKQYAITKYGY